jgi:hypothetical protein
MYDRLQNFIHGYEEEKDVFLGLQPIYQVLDGEKEMYEEVLLRGLAPAFHAAPYPVFSRLTHEDKWALFWLSVSMLSGISQISAFNRHFSVNLESEMYDYHELRELYASSQELNKFIIIELKDLGPQAEELIRGLSNYTVWLDDVEKEDYEKALKLLFKYPNIEAVKIDYKTSCILFNVMNPTKVPGEVNKGMQEYMALVSEETKVSVRKEFSMFYDTLKNLQRVKIIFELGVSPEMLTVPKLCNDDDKSEAQFMFTQGLKLGAMVKRIVCHSMSFVRGGTHAFEKMCGENGIPDRVAEYYARYSSMPGAIHILDR